MLQNRKWILRGAACCLALMMLCGCGAAEMPTEPITEPTTEPIETTQETTRETVAPNPYTPEDFTTEGEYVECIAGETKFGIDVSFWQGDIDWQQVKDAGVEFAMIRVGWRGTEQGTLGMDECAQKNYEGATAAGIQVGCYFFSQAISTEEAVEEAEYVLELTKDWQLDMPIVYDWEYISATARTGTVDARLLTDCTKAFCDRILQAGKTPMIYFNADQSFKQMFLDELTTYPFWLAMYESEMNYPYKIDMWQYSNTGSIPGIDGDVDLNIYFIYE